MSAQSIFISGFLAAVRVAAKTEAKALVRTCTDDPALCALLAVEARQTVLDAINSRRRALARSCTHGAEPAKLGRFDRVPAPEPTLAPEPEPAQEAPKAGAKPRAKAKAKAPKARPKAKPKAGKVPKPARARAVRHTVDFARPTPDDDNAVWMCTNCHHVGNVTADFGWRTLKRTKRDGTVVETRAHQPRCRPCRGPRAAMRRAAAGLLGE